MYYKNYWSGKNKYHNVSTEYNGKRYDSKMEANYAYELDMRVKAKEVIRWDRQITIHINFKKIKGNWILTDEHINDLKEKNIECYHLKDYRIDFVAYLKDGSEEWIEVKGMELPEWKMKFALTEMIFEKYKNRTLLVIK